MSRLSGFQLPEIKTPEIPDLCAEKERWQELQSASNKEGFDLHQTDWRDLILYNDSSVFDPSKEGNHGKVKLSFQYGKIYQDAKDPKTWYSKERSGDRAHGGEHWKRFEQQNKKLIEVGAIDMNGKVMNRNVGKNPVIIDIKNLKGIK